MIKPLDEYTPEERKFVEYVRQVRSQPPRPPREPGPLNLHEIATLIDEVPQEDRDSLVEVLREMRHRDRR